MAIFYTYVIGWTHLNKWYYGVRYCKTSDPKELWKTYFTSSEHVHIFRELNGDPDVIRIRKIFQDQNKARLWEHKALRRLKVVSDDKWLNKTDNICFDPVLMSELGKTKVGKLNNFYGKRHTEEYKRNMSEKKKKITEEDKKKISEATKIAMQKWRERVGAEAVAESYRKRAIKISESNKGQIPWSKGKRLSEDHKRKISESEKKTKNKSKI